MRKINYKERILINKIVKEFSDVLSDREKIYILYAYGEGIIEGYNRCEKIVKEIK